MQGPPAPNPMLAIFRALKSNHRLREELWTDPRGLISRLATPFPEEVLVRVFRDGDGRAYLETSLSLEPEDYQRSIARMRRCPLARMAADELVADPAGVLAPYGIRVPDDLVVLSEGDYVHFRVPLDEAGA